MIISNNYLRNYFAIMGRVRYDGYAILFSISQLRNVF